MGRVAPQSVPLMAKNNREEALGQAHVAGAVRRIRCASDWLQADRGYDANWYSDALKDKEDEPCSPGRQSRKSL